jgi:hypothetical protein
LMFRRAASCPPARKNTLACCYHRSRALHPRRSRSVQQPKRGRRPLFEPAIFEERFRTIERVFAWDDKFRRLLLRFDRLSQLHYAFKILAYTMINLRHYCAG